MAKLLHVSANVFPDLETEHSTKKIWKELSKGFDEYHILARSKNNSFHTYKQGNLYLHLVPNFKKAASFSVTSFYAISIIKKYNIDIILSQCPILGGFTANILAKIKKIPVFQEVHDTYYFDLYKSKKVRDRLLSIIVSYSVKNASKVRALNNMMAEMLISIVPSANISIIENRVDIKKFVAKKSYELHDPIRITSVGTFVRRKGYHTAIDAIKELRKQYNCELILVGGGTEKNNLRQQSNGFNDIKLFDRLPQEELAKILSDTDIYIQPSLREGMPRTILEAMAMRLPIVATNVSTIPGTIIHNVNGLIVEPEDSEGLANAIGQLINNEKLRNEVAQNAYNDAINKFEWDKSFEIYRTELINTIKEYKKARGR